MFVLLVPLFVNVKGTSYSDYQLYKVPSGVSDEYFLIENRAANGYDLGLYTLLPVGTFTGGISILHIDDNQPDNKDETHKLVDVEEANNAGLDNETDRGHVNNLFFSNNSTEFTPSTTPNSDRYNGSSSSVSITNVSATGATMTFDLDVN